MSVPDCVIDRLWGVMPPILQYVLDTETDTYIVERLFSSSLLVIVSKSRPNTLKVCHFKKGTEICNYSYPSKILAIKLNRQVSDPALLVPIQGCFLSVEGIELP